MVLGGFRRDCWDGAIEDLLRPTVHIPRVICFHPTSDRK